jgi:hypothetical protein
LRRCSRCCAPQEQARRRGSGRRIAPAPRRRRIHPEAARTAARATGRCHTTGQSTRCSGSRGGAGGRQREGRSVRPCHWCGVHLGPKDRVSSGRTEFTVGTQSLPRGVTIGESRTFAHCTFECSSAQLRHHGPN